MNDSKEQSGWTHPDPRFQTCRGIDPDIRGSDPCRRNPASPHGKGSLDLSGSAFHPWQGTLSFGEKPFCAGDAMFSLTERIASACEAMFRVEERNFPFIEAAFLHV